MRAALVLWILIGTVAAASAQEATGGRQGQRALQSQRIAAGELQSLLDGYAVIQGQQFLGLTDEQFAQFLPKFRAMQQTRRRNEMDRLRLIQEMNRLLGGGQAPENDLRERLRALRDLETRTTTELQKARDALDQTLDLRQQARFRVFEEQLEQRKLQLLMQVRQANRANRPAAGGRQNVPPSDESLKPAR